MMTRLNELSVAVLVTDGFEESELTSPVEALRKAGATVDIIAPHEGELQAYRHQEKSIKVKVDCLLKDVSPNRYDALVLPGGKINAGTLRDNEQALEFIRAFERMQKPIAAICHAPWELAAAGLVKGRTLTGYKDVADNIRIAGGIFVDREVVNDRNWITSRFPDDLPAFNRALIDMLAQVPKHQAA